MRTKASRGLYRTLQSLEVDLHTMLTNATLYNRKGDFVHSVSIGFLIDFIKSFILFFFDDDYDHL